MKMPEKVRILEFTTGFGTTVRIVAQNIKSVKRAEYSEGDGRVWYKSDLTIEGGGRILVREAADVVERRVQEITGVSVLLVERKWAIYAHSNDGSHLFQPAGRAVEYAPTKFEALKKLMTREWNDKDKAALNDLHIVDVSKEDE